MRGGGAVGRSWGAIRTTWETMWSHPAIFNLAFWALMILILINWVLVARVAPLVSKNFLSVITGGSAAALNHLAHAISPADTLRVLIFLLAVLFVATPFRVAGLYGGAWTLMQGRSKPAAPFQFFVSGARLFWRGVTAAVWGVLLVIVLAIVAGVLTTLGPIGLALALGLGLWALGGTWCALGALMIEPDRRSREIVWEVLRMAVRRWWDVLSLALMVGILFAAGLVVLDEMIRVPFIGLIALVVAWGVALGFTATIPFVLYQTWRPDTFTP